MVEPGSTDVIPEPQESNDEQSGNQLEPLARAQENDPAPDTVLLPPFQEALIIEGNNVVKNREIGRQFFSAPAGTLITTIDSSLRNLHPSESAIIECRYSDETRFSFGGARGRVTLPAGGNIHTLRSLCPAVFELMTPR